MDLPEELQVVRPALTVTKRDHTYQYNPGEKRGLCETLSNHVRESCRCDRDRAWGAVKAKLPILSWLPRYNFRTDFVGDVISGTTVAIMHIPQGMAYALLGGLPPVVGLYMAFFPVLMYVIMGTSPHVSMGTSAVISMMMGQAVGDLSSSIEERSPQGSRNESLVQDSVNGTSVTYTPIQVASALSLVVGFWQIVFGLLHLGEVFGRFLSDMLISGFTTGLAFQVLTSQVKSLFGISVPRHSGPFSIINTYVDIIGQLLSANVTVIIVSSITIIILVINNELIKPRVKKVTKLPIPIELLAVVAGTVASFFLDLRKNYNVRVVGDIPTGLPSPSVPPLELLPRLVVTGFIVGLVGYTTTFSMAKLFAKKKGYAVDATQELYAEGASNVFGCFFSNGPVAASMSRSLIQEGVGGVTLITPLISCVFILLILLFVGPLFETLPNCVLSSIIVVSLKGMFMQFHELAALWPVSKLDAIIWVSTFLTCVVINIDYGLFVGIGVSVLVLLSRSQSPSLRRLGRVPGTDLYLDCDKYATAQEIAGIRVVRIAGALHFANTAQVKEELPEAAGLREAGPPTQPGIYTVSGNTFKATVETMLSNGSISGENNQETDFEGYSKKVEKREILDSDDQRTTAGATTIFVPDTLWLVLDMSCVSFVDSSGGKLLSELHKELEASNVNLCLASPSEKVLKQLERCGTLDVLPKERLFHSVHDAVTILSRHSAPSPARAPEPREASVTRF
ncbi:solute carrier family 26 member 6-like [Penaeus monodon]|uniref:solute carrier family 26 member 6-like n=1 Tax=Penaeus monodon TaxID=6687 RepID=UPI0018A7C990|nr:solute carrier family 26 member 6-like [Penaeus monodon]XP_037796740.1 solute carrier family 26 member 6-like [Penaeus monodon]XP_037796741.1 solute carrier family 26 member 6-like [Penaeus monodon]